MCQLRTGTQTSIRNTPDTIKLELPLNVSIRAAGDAERGTDESGLYHTHTLIDINKHMNYTLLCPH